MAGVRPQGLGSAALGALHKHRLKDSDRSWHPKVGYNVQVLSNPSTSGVCVLSGLTRYSAPCGHRGKAPLRTPPSRGRAPVCARGAGVTVCGFSGAPRCGNA